MNTKFLLLLAALFGSSAGRVIKSSELDTYSYEQHIKDFALEHSEDRRKAFVKELARVRLHNSNPNKKWTETMNKFSTMSASEMTAMKGRIKASTKTHSNLKAHNGIPSDFKLKAVSELPAEVDWRTAGVVSAVKDQGGCGSCWAFSATATIESHVALSTGLLFNLSPEQIAMCSPNPDSCGGTGGCAGATAEIAFDYVSNSAGLFEEYQYGYTSYYGKNYDCALPTDTNPVATIDGYVQLPANNYTALMNAVATVGPISISVDAAWGAYESGVYDGCNQANPDIDHAVQLVGYGEENGSKYWLVRNSWSPAWGEQGYIKLARADTDDQNCGIDTTPQDGSACEGETDPVVACGTCGILFDSSYPLNVNAGSPSNGVTDDANGPVN